MIIPLKINLERYGGALRGGEWPIVLEIEVWRWGLAIQLPIFAVYETFIPDPDHEGNLITRPDLEARRAATLEA